MDLKNTTDHFTHNPGLFCLLGQQDGQPDTCDLQIFSGAVFAAKKDNSMDWLTFRKASIYHFSQLLPKGCVFPHILI